MGLNIASSDGNYMALPYSQHRLVCWVGCAEVAQPGWSMTAIAVSRIDQERFNVEWRSSRRRTAECHIRISEGRVIAEVNSENRAKRLRREIEKRLGVLAVHQSTRAQTLEEMRKNAPQEAEDAELHEAEMEAMLRDPEVRKELQAVMQKQVESWIHQKIPALGGRTPMQAVRDPDGKEMVEALLLDWERRDERDISPNQIRPDVGAIRRLLNLPFPEA